MTSPLTGSTPALPSAEAPRFFDGQRLTADDLTGAQDHVEQLRWLHQRSLHDWGIAYGLAVTGSRGDNAVTVGAGYAVDSDGRELIVPEPSQLLVPAISGAPDGGPAAYVLTVTYPTEDEMTGERRIGTCGSGGVVRSGRVAQLRWQEPRPDRGFVRGRDVVLAGISVEGCRLSADVSLSGRRDALPAQQPFVAAGSSPPGATAWRVWPEGSAPLGVTTTVTTSSAGFRSTPRYLAQIAGQRTFSGQLDGRQRDFVVDGVPFVADTTAVGFDLRVVLPPGSTFGDLTYATLGYDDVLNMYQHACNRWPGAENTPFANMNINYGRSISVGQTFDFTWTYIAGTVAGTGHPTVIWEDLKYGLDFFAEQNNTRGDDIVTLNNLNPANASLSMGQQLAIGTTARAVLNPTDAVMSPAFVGQLGTTLGWQVDWIGVEA